MKHIYNFRKMIEESENRKNRKKKSNKTIKQPIDLSKLKTEVDYQKVDKVEIVEITGILSDEEVKKIEEDFVVHAGDFSGKEVKRGDTIWLSCLLRKPGMSYSPSQQGVLKCRVTDIFLGLSKLNQIIK